MIGETFLMEFRKSWRGLLIFLIIIMITAGGFPQFYPTVSEAESADLEGDKNVELNVGGEMVNLSWDPRSNVTAYRVLEDNKSFMLSPEIVYEGVQNHTELAHKNNESRYFAVLALYNGSEEMKLIGMATTAEKGGAFDELIESSFYEGFTGGRDVRMSEIKGFLSVEFFSWWFLLAGLYIGYISVNSITKDFEEKRMDIIFSTPISRRRYLLEKFSAVSLYSLLLVIFSGLMMIASIQNIGYGSEVDFKYLMLALIGSWPVLMIVQSVAVLSAVYFVESRKAVGVTLLFAFLQYALQIIANMSSQFRWLLDYCILGYWDYNEALLDNSFSAVDFGILIVVAIMLVALSIYMFEKKDIPV